MRLITSWLFYLAFVLASVALLCVAAAPLEAGILTQNSDMPSENPARLAAWLSDIGIAAGQVEHFVDFETGFTTGQNISGIVGLLPGGLVITDTGPGTPSATIQSSSAFFGGSNPIDSFALAHDEQPFLELDFSARPVDYVSFHDIDHDINTFVTVEFVGGASDNITLDTTLFGGDSAEFFGIFRNDQPRISRVKFDVTKGDNAWGVDDLRYGILPEPSALLLLSLGCIAYPTFLRRHRR
jgi:hypothetical protein